MSYQVLARKWRPANFAEVAGQSHVLQSLVNALDNQRLHHAYLFTGTRGVGKTTLARILAKCLNCETGVSAQPCGECASCQEINEGRFIDLIEVDAASRTKVEDTRELLENVQYAPSRGRFKVYLIDEVHMLSNHSFNALLKTLEEPPSHVKFLFATTDPQKLPITILSRCLQFNLKNLSPRQIVDYLQTVLQKEAIEYDEESLWQIAAGAAGSMRDALTLADQAISYCQGKIAKSGVIEMLGVPAQQQVFELLSRMAVADVGAVLQLVNQLSERSPDYIYTLDSLLSCLHRLAIAQVAPKSLDNSFGDQQQLQNLARLFSAEDIQLFYQMGVKGRADLRAGTDLRAAFEMLLIRMMVFSPNLMDEELKPQLPAAIEPPSDGGNATSEQVAEAATVLPDSEPAKSAPALRPTAASQPEPAAGEPPAVKKNHPATKSSPTADNPEEPVDDGNAAEVLTGLDHQRWLELYPGFALTGIVANVLGNSQLQRVQDDTLYFCLDASCSAIFNDGMVPRLEGALSRCFSRSLQVSMVVGEPTAETPARQAARLQKARQDDLIQRFEQDDNVQQLKKRFAAQVAVESITPVQEPEEEPPARQERAP